MAPDTEQKHSENPGGIVDEIFEIKQELVKSKKLFRNFDSLRESVEILQKYKDDQFSEYQTILHNYENLLHDIKSFANQLLSLERSFLHILYFIRASHIKREFEELKWKFEFHEKELKTVMLTIVRKKEESKTEDFNTIYKILEDITEDNKSQELNQIQEIVKRQFDHDPNKIPSTLLTDPPYKSNLNNGNRIKKIYKNSIEVFCEPFTASKQNVYILKELFECSNILKFYGFSEVDGREVMVFEWASFGSLKEVYERRPISWDLKIKIAHDICKGLLFLKFVNVLHQDIRCENIMMTRHMEPKITNFQLAKKVSDVKVNGKGSILNIYNWAAPEMMQENSFYTQKCEIFSFGMLLWELAYQKIPYKETSAKEIRDYVIKGGRESLTFSSLTHPKIQEEFIKIIEKGWKHKDEERISLDEIILKLSELEDAPTDLSDQLPNHVNASNLKYLSHGLIIDMKKIQPSNSSAFTFEDKPETVELQVRKFQAKLAPSSKYKDSFLLENHIDQTAINSDDLDWMNITNPLKNEIPVNDIYLEVQNPRIELVLKKDSIKPSEILNNDIKNALNHHYPYRELMKAFKIYGHLIPERVILGNKLYMMSHLIANEKSPRLGVVNDEWATNDDFDTKCEKFFNIWEKHMKQNHFDSSYLISIDGDIVMRDDIKQWKENCLKGGNDFLHVISWKNLYPLYEIFDDPLRQEIKLILGNDDQTINSKIKEKVLMAGIIPVQDSITYYRVKFSHDLESNKYKIFGNLVTNDGVPNNSYVVKFKSMNIYGFSAIIENFNNNREMNIKNLQITWLLIGIPSEVGVYSSVTRNISILRLESHEFKFKGCENCEVPLNVPKDLGPDSILITSFVYPQSNYEPCLVAKISDYYDEEIKVNIYINKILDNDDLFQLEWGILLLKDEGNECDKNIGTDLIMPVNNFEAVGQSVYTKDLNKIFENIILTKLDLSYNKLNIEVEKALENALKTNVVTESLNLSHNHINLEMGTKLVDAFKANIMLTHLNLESTEIDPNVVVYLANVLENDKHLIDLNLSHNKLNREAGGALAKALEINNTLKILNLCNNNIESYVGKNLASALKNNKAIIDLDLSYNKNFDTKVIKILSESLESNSNKLEHLNLSFINLEYQAGIHLANSLEKNHTLKKLNLSSTNIGSVSVEHLKNLKRSLTGFNVKDDIVDCVTAKHLETALKENKTLTDLDVIKALEINKSLIEIDLSQNNINFKVGIALAKSLQFNSSLKK
ncbi:45660_t:CDS:2, partial [Gigaspora margarita]